MIFKIDDEDIRDPQPMVLTVAVKLKKDSPSVDYLKDRIGVKSAMSIDSAHPYSVRDSFGRCVKHLGGECEVTGIDANNQVFIDVIPDLLEYY